MIVNGKRITDYISFIWTERYNSCGDFELVIPFTSENSEFYKQDQIVSCNLSDRKMVVEKIQFSLTDENGKLMKISGRSLESIFDRRVFAYTAIYPDDYFMDNKLVQALSIAVSSSCGDLASSQYLTPYDTNPNSRSYQNSYRYEPERNIGVSYVKVLYDPYNHIKDANIYIDATGKSILDLIQTHCQNKDIGFMYNGGDTIYLYDGEDKSNDIEFSYENGNLISFDFLSDSTEYKNAVYVQGEEYQSRENVVTVNGITYKIKDLEKDGKMLVMNPDPSLQNPIYYRVLSKFKNFSGLSRREKYVDSSKSRGQNSDLKYGARLRAEGNVELLQSGIKTLGGAEVIHDQRFDYGTDYNLGDIVCIKIGDSLEIFDSDGKKVSVNTLKMRISELTISHSESGLDIYPVLTVYDPSKYDASNYTDAGYDPSEDSEEISNLNYDEIVEVLCLFNGGIMDYQNITYTEGSGFGNGIEGYWYNYPKMEEGVKVFNSKNITGLYSYQQRGDYLQLPTVTLTREHYIFNGWEKDETYIIPSYGPRVITIKALWKPVIHYIVTDPGEYGHYASNFADYYGNESVFEEWKKKEKMHSSFFVNDSSSTYNGCIIKMYEWNEVPSLKRPSYEKIRTEGSGDEKVTKRITWKDWSPSPVTRVEESEKRYTSIYDVEIVKDDDDDQDNTRPDNIRVGDDDIPIPDHYAPNGLEGGADPLKENVLMAHFVTPKTNNGATFGTDNQGRYVQIGSGGSVHSHYEHEFTLKFIVMVNGEKKVEEKKLIMCAHLLSGAGYKNYENNTTPQGEKIFYDSGFFPMHLTFLNKDNKRVYHDFSAEYIGFILKIPEISFSAAPMAVQYYEHLRLKDKYINWDVMDPIPFMPYKYGTNDGHIYQRPPSDWMTNWYDYYELNDPNGGEIGYCICYYDGDGKRIDPNWSADYTSPGIQNANARTIEINGEVFYPYYPCTYGFYYVMGSLNYGTKRGTNTIFSPYSLIYADAPSQGYGYSSDTSRYYLLSGWRFFVIKNLDSGNFIDSYTGDYSSRTNQLYNNNGVGVTITCAKNIYGPLFPDKTYINRDYDRGSGDAKASAYMIAPSKDASWPFTVPSAGGPMGGSQDALNKMAGDTVSQVRIIKKTGDVTCTSVAFARFECVAYLPGCDLSIRWQVAAGYKDDGGVNWQDIPETQGKSVIFIPCTNKKNWELAEMGYEGIYQYLGTDLSDYRCVLSYMEEDTTPWKPQNPNQDPPDDNEASFYDGTSIPNFGPSSYEPLNAGSIVGSYHWPTNTGRYLTSFSLSNWQWAIMNSKAYRSTLKAYYKSWKPMYDRDPYNTTPFERFVAPDIVSNYTIEDARRILDEESRSDNNTNNNGMVDMVGTTGRIYIDDSPYPDGIIITDNPDLEGDDSYGNPEDNINNGRKRDDIPKDTQDRIVDTIKSMNGDTYPHGESRENTISVLVSKYKISTQVAAEMINVAYGRIQS